MCRASSSAVIIWPPQLFETIMGFLAGKRLLITGVISNRSIAYGIAAACKREGAELAFTYQNERIKDRVTEFAQEFGSSLVFPCDVGSDEQIEALFVELGKHWDGFDGLVHSIAFAPKEALAGDYLSAVTRENFRIAHDISSYSFAALAKAALPMMEGRQAALLTLSYLGLLYVSIAAAVVALMVVRGLFGWQRR